MARSVGPIVALVAAALLVPSAQGVPAAGPGYRASFQVTYDSPPFPETRHRVTVSFAGEVCGDPFTGTWLFEATRTGGPSAPLPTLSPVTFAAANPINVTGDRWLDANGTEIAAIEFIVRFARGAAPTITPSWETTGDIQNVVATPTPVPVAARTLPDCSAAQPPPPPPRPPGTVATGDRMPGRLPGSVKVPGSQRFVTIAVDQALPSGTVVDVSRGRGIRLTDRTGDVLDVYGVRDGVPSQARLVRNGGFVELRLTGGRFKTCATVAQGQATKPVRRLWAKGVGGYRTTGRYAAGTIRRGPWWLTADFCDRTLVRVRQGSMVVTDFVKRKNVVVNAPKSYRALEPR